MARSSRSTTPAAPTSGCSRSGSATSRRAGPRVYQAFDLLYLDGRSLLDVPLEDRKRLLKSVLRPHPRVRFAAHVDGEGLAFYRGRRGAGPRGHRRQAPPLALRARPAVGVVAQGQDPAGAGARGRWLDAGRGERARTSGAVAVGVYEDGRLRFAGKVGSGFDARTRTAAPRAPRRRSRPTTRRSTRRRRATIAAAGAATCATSTGSGRSSSSAPSSAAGRATGWSARRRSRGSRRAATRATVAREVAVDDRRRPSARPRRPSPGADPEAPAVDASVADAPTRATLGRVTDDELAALDALGKEGVWRVGGDELKLTNLDKPLFAARRPTTADHQARPHRATSPGSRRRCCRTSRDRPLNLQRFPNGAGAPGFWQKDIPETAPDVADPLARDRASTAARTAAPTTTSSPTAWRPCAGSATRRASRSTPGPGACPSRGSPTFALIDIDPGEKTTWEETLVLARLYRTALGHLGVRGYPKTTGKRGIQVWIPIEPQYEFDETSAWVERVSRAVGATVPGPRVVGVGEGGPQGPRPPRLHPEREHQDARRAVRRAAGRRRPGLRADHLGRAGRPGPAPRPLDDPDDRRAGRGASATCSPPPRPTPRSSPRSERRPAPCHAIGRVAGCADARRHDPPPATRHGRTCSPGASRSPRPSARVHQRRGVRVSSASSSSRIGSSAPSMARRGSGPAAPIRSG